MSEGKIVARTYPAGTVKFEREATINDSDKTFTVPARKIRLMKWIDVILSTSATVGNRALRIDIGDGTHLLTFNGGASLTASSTGHYMAFFTGPGDDWGLVNYTAVLPFPPMSLLAGYTVRVWDSAAVDAAADDMTVVLHYEELDV